MLNDIRTSLAIVPVAEESMLRKTDIVMIRKERRNITARIAKNILLLQQILLYLELERI